MVPEHRTETWSTEPFYPLGNFPILKTKVDLAGFF